MDVVSQKRGKNVAILGMILQLLFALIMLGVWRFTDSLAAMTCTWLLAGGFILWLAAMVLFYAHQRERQETLELAQIAAQAAKGSIFDDETQTNLRPAKAHLAWVMRWLVPLFTLLLAAFQTAIAILMVGYLRSRTSFPLDDDAIRPVITVSILFVLGTWFVAFLFSRYCVGMGSQEVYRPLRATGSYLLFNVLSLTTVVISLGFGYNDNVAVDLYVAYALCGIQLLLAVELVLNFIMDIYRPRVPGQEQRLSFDSRLLNLLAQPGRIGHSIAEALNYQFGFEVSKTWFYQLLGKALVPMIVAGGLILLALSCIVMVQTGEQAVIFHMGKMQETPLKEGVHLKWPWPIDTCDRYNVGGMHEVLLGTKPRTDDSVFRKTIIRGRELNLWSMEHGLLEEQDFLVAVKPRDDGAIRGALDKKPPAVNVIKLAASLQYRIDDVAKYAYRYRDPDEMIKCIAYREMIGYLAGATLQDKDDLQTNRPQAIMTSGQRAAEAALQEKIQAAVGDLGVHVTYFGFTAVHPPSAAAPAYEQVLEAERRQDEQRYQAQAEANRILAKVAGSPASAISLAFAIRKIQELEPMSLAAPAERTRQADDALRQVQKDRQTLEQEIRQDLLLGKISVPVAAKSQSAPALASAVGTTTGPAPAAMEVTDRQRLLQEYDLYIQQLQKIKGAPQNSDFAALIADANDKVDALFRNTAGTPAQLVANAEAQRWDIEMRERARAEAFEREEMAYLASPNIYVLDRWLDVWDESLPNITKYVMGVDRDRVQLWMNLQQESEPSDLMSSESTSRTGNK